jgi:Domain of unknown function (DUF4397)
MKIYTMQSKGFLTCICAVGLLALILPSCSKPAVSTNISTPQAALNFVQACPDEAAVDLLINNSKVSQALTYGQYTGYFALNAGNNIISFNNDATMQPILADTASFNPNTIHTLFLTNTVSQPQVFALTDTLVAPTTGNASVRFVDVSPDAPAVDLVIKGGATLVSNRSFKGYSSFAAIPANIFYNFEVHKAGTATVLATLSNVKVNPGFVYTIWFHGLANGTTANGDELSADFMINASF